METTKTLNRQLADVESLAVGCRYGCGGCGEGERGLWQEQGHKPWDGRSRIMLIGLTMLPQTSVKLSSITLKQREVLSGETNICEIEMSTNFLSTLFGLLRLPRQRGEEKERKVLSFSRDFYFPQLSHV